MNNLSHILCITYVYIICIKAICCASKCENRFNLDKHCEVVFKGSCPELQLVAHPCSPISGNTHKRVSQTEGQSGYIMSHSLKEISLRAVDGDAAQ